MIKIAEKTKGYVHVFSEDDPEAISKLKEKLEVVLEDTYNGYPSIVVRVER